MLDAKALEASRAAYQSAIPDGAWHANGGETDAPIRAAITAYIQAVGPEPAVAVKPLEWKPNSKTIENSLYVMVDEIDRDYTIDPESNVFRLQTRLMLSEWDSGDLGLFPTVEAAKAAGQADHDRRIASRIRSALVATPPAEPVVEDIRKAVSTTMMRHIGPDGWTIGRGGCPRINWHQLCNELVAALTAKPAVKGDEAVVEALPLREIRRRVRNIWGAISSNQVIDKDVEGQAKRLLADIDAALAAKDGRS